MVTTPNRTRQKGYLIVEAVMAMSFLLGIVFVLALTTVKEKRLMRIYYERSVAMEVIDGEMEVLKAGEFRQFQPGRHEYQIRPEIVPLLPPGQFYLTVEPARLRLEWQPTAKHRGGTIQRVCQLPQPAEAAK